jgi:hypothetical protein
MARRSLRPHLNQIRSWVRQGRTDAWIAHQLEVTVQQIEAFKQENELADGAESNSGAADFDDEIDLRAEDDALIAAELDAVTATEDEVDDDAGAETEGSGDDSASDAGNGEKKPRRRSRRGGRGRGKRDSQPLEGTFDHGEEGYGLWIDPAVADDPVYAEHWAGHRPVEVTIEEDQIVLRRSGEREG